MIKMKEQIIIIPNNIPFELKHIFECGQCFRWNMREDGSYIGVVRKNVIEVQKNEKEIIIKSLGEDDIKELCNTYFDLNRDYKQIQNKLSSIDEYLETSIKYGNGIRILHQDLWETIISYIISANNNIPRIKGIIERISAKYGEKIVWKGKEYYTFPTIEELSKASIEDLRALGLGFRDKRVYETTRIFYNKKITLEQLENMDDTEKIRERLLELPGVGRKVADCILLFGLNRFEVFPIDVWVNRLMNELYIKAEDENKIDKTIIQDLAKDKYKELAGIAQQYLFFYRRENKFVS